MATNLRFNVAIGQRLTYYISPNHYNKSITLFYEVGTNDLYFIQYIKNKTIKLHEILDVSIGVKIGLY
jgi:hypothetical protein